MTEKRETLRELLERWKSLFADPESSGYDASTRECYRELAPIVERLEQMVEEWRNCCEICQGRAYQFERDVLGRKD